MYKLTHSHVSWTKNKGDREDKGEGRTQAYTKYDAKLDAKDKKS